MSTNETAKCDEPETVGGLSRESFEELRPGQRAAHVFWSAGKVEYHDVLYLLKDVVGIAARKKIADYHECQEDLDFIADILVDVDYRFNAFYSHKPECMPPTVDKQYERVEWEMQPRRSEPGSSTDEQPAETR